MKHYDLDGQEVARLREAKGLSQVDFAEKIGVVSSYVSLLESGTRQPSSSLTLKIAKVLGVKFADITTGKELEPAKAAS